jgi:glycosyltransferase involved in cell wall biosynthesis
MSRLGNCSAKKMRLAICGIRGIPACYGGFETFAEELATRLVSRGHDVVVYGRKHVISYTGNHYRGVRIRLLPAPRHKYLETPLHTVLCFLDLFRNPVDAALVCNAANSPFLWLARLRGIPVALNLDGIERMRKKWNWLGRCWYRFGEVCSVLFASRLIADAEVIRQYYVACYGAKPEVIGYGYNVVDAQIIGRRLEEIAPDDGLALPGAFSELGIIPGKYILYVSRLEPENNAHVVIEAYNRLPQSLKSIPLLIVGDAPYSREYITELRQAAGPGVIFAGYRFGEQYSQIQRHALVYVQATEVGGTHPALVEAMGFANCVLANDTPENREVLADAGLFYEKNDPLSLHGLFSTVLGDCAGILRYRKLAYERAVDKYNWEEITNHYERLFCEMV